MPLQVSVEGGRLAKPQPTEPALVALPLRLVHLHVLLDVVGARKASLTQAAGIRSLTAVYANVTPQLGGRAIRLAAHEAAVRWIAPIVSFYMSIHILSRFKLLATVTTHVLGDYLNSILGVCRSNLRGSIHLVSQLDAYHSQCLITFNLVSFSLHLL